MRILEMRLKSIDKNIEHLFNVLFGAYIAGVLWITLFSRIGNEYRGFLYPFYSYREILKGNRRYLFENVGNIVLFLPLGAILKCMGVNAFKRSVVIGFLFSCTIEILQAIFSLGTFECDDIMHNTLGVLLGFELVKRVARGFQVDMNRKNEALVIFSIILCVLLLFLFCY